MGRCFFSITEKTFKRSGKENRSTVIITLYMLFGENQFRLLHLIFRNVYFMIFFFGSGGGSSDDKMPVM